MMLGGFFKAGNLDGIGSTVEDHFIEQPRHVSFFSTQNLPFYQLEEIVVDEFFLVQTKLLAFIFSLSFPYQRAGGLGVHLGFLP